MAEKEKHGEVSHISICKAKNGYKICCSYEDKEKTLGQRAGWVPCGPCETEDWVEKTKDAVIKRLEEIL
jgi:hypothetical protein